MSYFRKNYKVTRRNCDKTGRLNEMKIFNHRIGDAAARPIPWTWTLCPERPHQGQWPALKTSVGGNESGSMGLMGRAILRACENETCSCSSILLNHFGSTLRLMMRSAASQTNGLYIFIIWSLWGALRAVHIEVPSHQPTEKYIKIPGVGRGGA